MKEITDNEIYCRRLIQRLLGGLDLVFVPAKEVTKDGWYLWRNSPDWPAEEYQMFEIAHGRMIEPEPLDTYGSTYEMVEREPYGQLAGPIIGR